MGAPKTVTGKVETPDGIGIGGAVITASLPSFTVVNGDTFVFIGPVKAISVADGSYTMLLYSNQDLSVTGTFYLVRESYTFKGQLVESLFRIVVPSVGSSFVMSSLIQ